MAQIVSPENLLELRTEWRRNATRAVLAMGAFDLLHPGHVRLLEQARSLGDVLVVAVENDDDVHSAAQKNRGARVATDRPVVPLAERAEIVAALAAVDFVTELRDISAEDWVARFQPDIYVKGGTRPLLLGTAALVPEKAEGTNWDTVNIPLEPGYSTALLIERIQQFRQ